jgi:hypothetical protein
MVPSNEARLALQPVKTSVPRYYRLHARPTQFVEANGIRSFTPEAQKIFGGTFPYWRLGLKVDREMR